MADNIDKNLNLENLEDNELEQIAGGVVRHSCIDFKEDPSQKQMGSHNRCAKCLHRYFRDGRSFCKKGHV